MSVPNLPFTPEGPDRPAAEGLMRPAVSEAEGPVGLVVEQEGDGRALLGVAIGAALGLVAAIAYVALAVISGREWLMLAVLIGVGVGWGTYRWARRDSVVLGIVAAAITVVLFVAATFAEATFLLAKEFDAPVADAAAVVREVPGEVLSGMFDEFLDYVWFAGALGYAFYQGSGFAARRKAAAVTP